MGFAKKTGNSSILLMIGVLGKKGKNNMTGEKRIVG